MDVDGDKQVAPQGQGLTRHDRLREKAEAYARLREEQAAVAEVAKRKARIRRYSIALMLLLVAGGLIGWRLVTPGRYDGFAKCLAEKGAIMYGAIEWCSYTKAQAGMFGKSFKYVDYRDYKEIDDVQKTPTWVIGGERYPGVQSFERLAALTGCSYSGGVEMAAADS